MSKKKIGDVVRLNEFIDDVIDELLGSKTTRQMVNESLHAGSKKKPIKEYGLLAHPPSYNPAAEKLRGFIREVVEEKNKHFEVGQSITQMIGTLHMRSDVATEFKHKVNELSRRLKMNGFSGYDYYEIATDKQQDIFGMNLTPQGFPEALLSVEDWVDSLAFIFRFGTNDERDEAQYIAPITYQRISDLYPEWWDESYDAVDVRQITHPKERAPQFKMVYPSTQVPPEFEGVEDEMIRQANANLK